MEKIIKIGDVEVKLSNNVAWTMEYRNQFNTDVMEAIMPVITSLVESVSAIISDSSKGGQIDIYDVADAVQGRAFDITLPLTQLKFTDVFVNVLWAMAKAADPTIEPVDKWVRQFDTFPLDEIVPVVGDMVLKGFASSKNLERLRSWGKNIAKTQPIKK